MQIILLGGNFERLCPKSELQSAIKQSVEHKYQTKGSSISLGLAQS